MKADIYQALNTINRGFADALESLKTLQKEGLLKAEFVQDQTVCTKELLAGINAMILDHQGRREDEDRDHFGLMRYKIEERNRREAGDPPQPMARKDDFQEGEHETTTTAKRSGKNRVRTIRQRGKAGADRLKG
jgi:hypothetical protein